MARRVSEKKMPPITLDVVYGELRQIRKEINDLRSTLIPVEEISETERLKLDRAFKEMEEGNETPWRKVKAKGLPHV